MLFELSALLVVQTSTPGMLATGHHMAPAQKCYYQKGNGPKTFFPCHAQMSGNSSSIDRIVDRAGDGREQSIDFDFQRYSQNCLYDPVNLRKVCYSGTTYLGDLMISNSIVPSWALL